MHTQVLAHRHSRILTVSHLACATPLHLAFGRDDYTFNLFLSNHFKTHRACESTGSHSGRPHFHPTTRVPLPRLFGNHYCAIL